MASPLAFSSSSSLAGEYSFGKEDDGGSHGGFKQSRPMNLVIARSPVFTVPPGLSPSGFLNSPGFFSPQVIHPFDPIGQFLFLCIQFLKGFSFYL